ncbi:hypothetical protein N9B89_04620, partial [Flavobacteriales bacterium]|nr:hypothetical protein [Flavobacteriales bacterium]
SFMKNNQLTNLNHLLNVISTHSINNILLDYNISDMKKNHLLKIFWNFFSSRYHLFIGNKQDNEKLLFQLAYEQAQDSPISKQAQKLIFNKRIKWPWLKQLNRKKYFEFDPNILRLQGGHSEDINGCIVMNNNQIISWSRTRGYKNGLKVDPTRLRRRERGLIVLWNLKDNSKQNLNLDKSYGINGVVKIDDDTFFSYTKEAITIWDIRSLKGRKLIYPEKYTKIITEQVEKWSGYTSPTESLPFASVNGKELTYNEDLRIGNDIWILNTKSILSTFSKKHRIFSWNLKNDSCKVLEIDSQKEEGQTSQYISDEYKKMYSSFPKHFLKESHIKRSKDRSKYIEYKNENLICLQKFSDNQIVTVSDAGRIRLWDLDKNRYWVTSVFHDGLNPGMKKSTKGWAKYKKELLKVELLEAPSVIFIDKKIFCYYESFNQYLLLDVDDIKKGYINIDMLSDFNKITNGKNNHSWNTRSGFTPFPHATLEKIVNIKNIDNKSFLALSVRYKKSVKPGQKIWKYDVVGAGMTLDEEKTFFKKNGRKPSWNERCSEIYLGIQLFNVIDRKHIEIPIQSSPPYLEDNSRFSLTNILNPGIELLANKNVLIWTNKNMCYLDLKNNTYKWFELNFVSIDEALESVYEDLSISTVTIINNTVLFSSKKTLYSWDCDKDIKLEYKGHKSTILNIYIKNENEVVTIAEDDEYDDDDIFADNLHKTSQELIFWRLDSGSFKVHNNHRFRIKPREPYLVDVLKHHSNLLSKISDNKIVSFDSREILLWDFSLIKFKETQELEDVIKGSKLIAFDNNHLVYINSSNNALTVFNIKTDMHKEIGSFPNLLFMAKAHQNYLLMVEKKGVIKLFNIKSKKSKVLTLHDKEILGVMWVKKEYSLLSWSLDGVIKVSNIKGKSDMVYLFEDVKEVIRLSEKNYVAISNKGKYRTLCLENYF